MGDTWHGSYATLKCREALGMSQGIGSMRVCMQALPADLQPIPKSPQPSNPHNPSLTPHAHPLLLLLRHQSLHEEWVPKFFQYTGFNLLLAFSCTMSLFLISPAASGSGIPDVKAYLNGVESPIFRCAARTTPGCSSSSLPTGR